MANSESTLVGITGHQHLPDAAAWEWTEVSLRQVLNHLKRPFVGISSLAAGADQLFARIVLQSGGELKAVLPFAGIDRTLSGADLDEYRRLLIYAHVEILSTPGSVEDAFFAAGKRVVDSSNFVIAVWDGEPARGRGGTADIVEYARTCRKKLVWVDPIKRAIEGLDIL